MQVLGNRHENVRYIVDGAKPCVWLAAVQSFVAHYPEPSRYKGYKEYMKLRAAAGAPMYMPLWDDQELDIVRQRMHPAMSEWQVRPFRILSHYLAHLTNPPLSYSCCWLLFCDCISLLSLSSADAAAYCTKGSSPKRCAGEGVFSRIRLVYEGGSD